MSGAHTAMRIAVEGCGHGTLDAIYASVQKSCAIKGWDGVDLVIIGGDFQAVRDKHDLNVTAMPAKYRTMADFHQYYWGVKTAPFLTVFIGGNHEASNHLFELYYGGWVAPNIYYLGAANVIQVGSLKIAGLSGIWKGYDYRKPHFERLPYNQDEIYSIYHVRELDSRKLLSFRSQVDIGMSHDWPKGIEWLGDHEQLFKHKPHLLEDAQSGKLGNTAAKEIMDRLRPMYWFSAHLHTKYAAIKNYNESTLAPETNGRGGIPSSSPHSEQILAWNSFASRALQEETEAIVRLDQEVNERREQAERMGIPMRANYVFNETYKKVKVGNGLERDVTVVSHDTDKAKENQLPMPQLDGCCSSLPRKRSREPTLSPEQNGLIANPDAIDIDMSDEDEDEEDGAKSTAQLLHPPITDQSQRGNVSLSSQPLNVAPSSAEQNPSPERTVEAQTESEHSQSVPVQNEVSEDIRTQLAALSSKFEEPVQTSSPLPQPETITNQTTKFLALSKCEDRQNFLQLLEVPPFEASDVSIERPIKMRYVPEWLAILRVFAPELSLGGSPKDQVPRHRGDTYYRERIIEEEKWIQENVVDAGHINVPENFKVDIFDYQSVGAEAQDSAREVTNSQTSVFCNLIGIDNPFDVSAEERNARMEAGPAETSDSTRGSRGGQGRGGRGRGHHGGRGGSSRGGRGQGGRGWGARGRGRRRGHH